MRAPQTAIQQILPLPAVMAEEPRAQAAADLWLALPLLSGVGTPQGF